MIKLPPILPSPTSDRPSTVQLDKNSYERWRTNIHRELEEDLQRQVREVLEETERQERLAKLQRQIDRASQCFSNQQNSTDAWNEIDRRNEHVLHPINSKNLSKSKKLDSSFQNQFNHKSKQAFYLNYYNNYNPRRQSAERSDDQDEINSSNYVKYMKNLTTNQHDPSLLIGNSIIKSNKADILNVFQQQLNHGIKKDFYTNRFGVIINEDGPFWPENHRILHPTPKLLNREIIPKEFYLTPNASNTNNRQTFDSQPAMFKYINLLKHPIVVYDMDKTPRIQPIKANENDNICPHLIFESRFECGNLRQVKHVGQFEYELVLRTDLYTRRHTQWYYFRVQNMIANITYRFRIINLMKKTSLYNEGMQLLLFSEVDAKKENRGWHRVGHHINYSEYKQRSYNSLLDRDLNYYELDFQLEFKHSGDTCYIAHCYPYTFSDLRDDLECLSTTRPREIFRREVLCESQAGNSCFMITVTDESVPTHKKKFVFITARIHPGETNSSYMMRGLLEFITSNDKIAQKLRSQLVFKIIPMLNPDGVIVGNYRCSLTGKDMNRNFRHPRKQTFPIIYHMKELIQNLQKEQREILAFCDLHGHSRKSNVFAYGCDGCDGPQPDMNNFLNARVLPFIMSRTAPEMFSFDYCKFHIQRCKESTGRVVMWKEMLIKNSFTLEASFAGSSIVEKPCHFNIQDYEKFGQCICQSLRQYLDILSDSSRLNSILMDITRSVLLKLDKTKIPRELLSKVYHEEKQFDQLLIPINSVSNCLEILTQCHETINKQDASSSSDSDSDPEGGELPEVVIRKEEDNKTKKNVKRRRSDKSTKERIQKSNLKRQVNRPKSLRVTNKMDEYNTQRLTRANYPHTSEIDMNSQLKVGLNVDQMEKANRVLPERNSLFQSKYAHRTGNGLPIFTTERAMERRYQKKDDQFLRDLSPDQQMSDEYDSDNDESGILYTKLQHSPGDLSPKANRTASLFTLPKYEYLNPTTIQSFNPPVLPPSPMFKGLPQRRLLQRNNRPQQSPNKLSNMPDGEQTNNKSPPIITVPHLMDFRRRLSHSSSANDSENESTVVGPNVETIPLDSIPECETPPVLQMKRSNVNVNANAKLKRSLSQKPNNLVVQQPLSSIESILKDRSNNIKHGHSNQPDAAERVNQIISKQVYLPFEKNKRL